MSVPYFFSSEGLAFRSLEIPTKGIPLDKNFYPATFLLYSLFCSMSVMHNIKHVKVCQKTCLNRTGYSQEDPVIWIFKASLIPSGSPVGVYFTFLWDNSSHRYILWCNKTKKSSDNFIPLLVDNSMISQTVVMMINSTLFTSSTPILQAQLPAKTSDYRPVQASHTTTFNCCKNKHYFYGFRPLLYSYDMRKKRSTAGLTVCIFNQWATKIFVHRDFHQWLKPKKKNQLEKSRPFK